MLCEFIVGWGTIAALLIVIQLWATVGLAALLRTGKAPAILVMQYLATIQSGRAVKPDKECAFMLTKTGGRVFDLCLSI